MGNGKELEGCCFYFAPCYRLYLLCLRDTLAMVPFSGPINRWLRLRRWPEGRQAHRALPQADRKGLNLLHNLLLVLLTL